MRSQIQQQWEVAPLLSKEQFQAAQHVGLVPLQAQLLANRGITTVEEMAAFLRAEYDETPDPLTLIDMPRAVERIRRALQQHEHITVYGDYDADGVTSCALLFRALRMLKGPEAALDYAIPHRQRDGCGLNLAALDTLKARGTQLLITTDCGSSDVEQVAYGRSLGIDIIITDHHHPPSELPQAYAIVNPWHPDCLYGERSLCGVGVAFKLTQALYRAYKRPKEEEMDLLDLVAMGTIADLVPLLGENHTLVRLGMQCLNTTQKPGLKALIRKADLQPGRIRERDISYGLAPRLNAAGRMKDASIAFELLVTESEKEAEERVAELEQLNLIRQRETEDLMRIVREQAQGQLMNSVILVQGEGWHEGIIGLVAGKLAEEVNKPMLVLCDDRETHLSRGSARSRKGFNIIEALRGFADQLERYGGHAQAAGFTIRRERVEALHNHLLHCHANGITSIAAKVEIEGIEDHTNLVPEGEERGQESTPSLRPHLIDLIFTRMERLNYSLYKTMRTLGPFGAGNPEPIFKMERLHLLDMWSSGINKQNLRLRLGADQGNAQLLGTLTGGAMRSQTLIGIAHVNIIFRLESLEDEQKQEVWVKILDVEPALSEEQALHPEE